MHNPSHQTIKLSRGKHAGPAQGACVMELASMLAGERFTDRPKAASPIVATVLRCYNDGLDDRRRQDLYRYAAASVGTRETSADAERLEACRFEFGVERSRFGRLGRRSELRAIGRKALRRARTIDDAGHARFLEFLDALVGVTRGGISEGVEPRIEFAARDGELPAVGTAFDHRDRAVHEDDHV
jgi:hypothetical protein